MPGKNILTLQTCTLPDYEQRLIVQAELTDTQNGVGPNTVDDGLLEGQLAYYRARAGEYDEWFLRTGRYDRGPEWNRRWFSELEQVRRELDGFGPTGEVLELACGTGLWTRGARASRRRHYRR